MPTPPPNQTLRQVGFALLGGANGDQFFTFGIRPEDLTIQEPSRLTVQQTLGGAWADSFGQGVTTITLAGHNGWRGGIALSGEELFLALRDTIFVGWHEGRAAATSQGQDPDGVQLYFTDGLDSYAAIVAPRSFTLRRSKSSPLLMRYQVQLLVLGPADGPGVADDPIVSALANPLRWVLAVNGLVATANAIERFAGLAVGAFGAFAAAITNFLFAGVALIRAVLATARAVIGQFTGLVASILFVAIDFCYAARNAFEVLADDITLTAASVLSIMSLGAMFNDAACAMVNAFDLIGVFPDWSAMRGASSCSSTGGGDPINVFSEQGVNPFVYAFPPAVPIVTVTDDARAAIATLRGDPITFQGQQTIVADLMRRAGNGTAVPA